jgi:hypothetical protein
MGQKVTVHLKKPDILRKVSYLFTGAVTESERNPKEKHNLEVSENEELGIKFKIRKG